MGPETQIRGIGLTGISSPVSIENLFSSFLGFQRERRGYAGDDQMLG